ncbi:MAG: hypothetical protein AAGI44_06075 [Pseudomonadota bacterium]
MRLECLGVATPQERTAIRFVLTIGMLIAWLIVHAENSYAQDPNIQLPTCNQDYCQDKNFQVGRNPGSIKGVHLFWACANGPGHISMDCTGKQNIKKCKRLDGGCYCEFNEHLAPGALANLAVEVCCVDTTGPNNCPDPIGGY